MNIGSKGMQMIRAALEVQEILREREKGLIEAEKKKVLESPLDYVEKYLSKSDNYLSIPELNTEVEKAEIHYKGIIKATASLLYVNEYAAQNNVNANEKLQEVDQAKTAILHRLKETPVTFFQEQLDKQLKAISEGEGVNSLIGELNLEDLKGEE